MTWYKDLGYSKNPFSIKPNEGYELFFDDKSLVDDVLKNIDDGKNIVLRGAFGTGKTSILKTIIDEFGGERKLYYYNAYSKSSNIDFSRVLKNAGGFFSRLFKIKSKDVVLFIDEVHHLSNENLIELNDYYGEYFKSIVFASSNKSYEVTKDLKVSFDYVNLDNFTEKDAFSMVKDRLGEDQDILNDSEILDVYKKSFTPRDFLLSLESYCKDKYSDISS